MLRSIALGSLSALTAVAIVGLARPALAYRPFDGTDADVASFGEIELELGPLGYIREGDRKSLVAPSVVYNLGVAPRWELVAEARGDLTPWTTPRARVREAGLFFKTLLREGALQDRGGPSVATEFGIVAPTGGETGATSIAVIASERWAFATVHLNAQILLNRERGAGGFGGVILEGPESWRARPVVEIFAARDPGATTTTYSGLLGLIWPAGEALDFDTGIRIAKAEQREGEIRAGLTWRFDTR
jgi:hypothetical protein